MRRIAWNLLHYTLHACLQIKTDESDLNKIGTSERDDLHDAFPILKDYVLFLRCPLQILPPSFHGHEPQSCRLWETERESQ